MSWHAPSLPKWKGGGEKNFSKNSCGGLEILTSKKDSVMGQVNFLKEVKGIFGGNRKFHNCSEIKQNHASKDSICTKVN